MARTAIFDPFSGASGDMILGALVDAGTPIAVIQEAVARLALQGVRISAATASSGAVRGTHVRVEQVGEQPPRDWRAIRELLESSALDPEVRQASLSVFSFLASAEAAAHDVPADDVHFHEVGAADAIVDVVGSCAALAHLSIEQVASNSVAVGSGWVHSEHGLLPVPAPATAIILAQARAPVRPAPDGSAQPGELLTPTGAAILAALADWRVPSFVPERVAYGFGSRQLPWPNALRLWIAEMADVDAEFAEELLLESNIDDMNPQFFAPLSERLLAAGALDVWLTPTMMKKGRPATIVSAIVPAHRREEVERTFFINSTTLGVRAVSIDRTRAPRLFVPVITRWGEVQLKLRGWDGRVIGAMPEYDDCQRLSQESGAPIQEIWGEANRLGEVIIGRRWDELSIGMARPTGTGTSR